jgi:hypothetical protein
MSNFMSMLQTLFIGLKLTGHINWSWWGVLAPSIVVIIFMIIDDMTRG